jgi:hypothetical protein
VLSSSGSCRDQGSEPGLLPKSGRGTFEEGALSGLCHKIGDHIAGWAPLDSELLLLYPVSNKIVPDIDVLSALAAGGFAILFQQHGTAIVLVDNVLTDFSSLSLDKVSSPADGWHAVIDTNEL